MSEQPDTAEAASQLAWAVHDLAVAIAEADVAMSAALQVTTGDYLAVKHLLLRPGQLGPVELGRLLGMSSGSATTLIDRLAAAGHVVRRPHEHDRRRRVLLVSDDTQARLHLELQRQAVDIDDIARAYTDDQRQAIASFLSAVAVRRRVASRQPAVRR